MHTSAWHVPLEAAPASAVPQSSSPTTAQPAQGCPSPSHAEMSSSSAGTSSGIKIDADDTDSQNSSPEENRRKRKHSSSGRFRNHKNTSFNHSQALTPDEIEKKRKMNREYARKSRQKKSDEISMLKERCKEQEVIIEIYKKAITILYARVNGNAPTWAMRQLSWFPSQGSRHKTPNNVECFLPECDEKFFVELGNNAYGQLYQSKPEVPVQPNVKLAETTTGDRQESRHIGTVDAKEPLENIKVAPTSSASQLASSARQPAQVLVPPKEEILTPSPVVAASHHHQLPYIPSESNKSYPVFHETALPLHIQKAIKEARQNPASGGGVVIYVANPESTQAPTSEASREIVETVYTRMVDHPHAVNLVKRELSSNPPEYEVLSTANLPIVSGISQSHLGKPTSGARENMTGLKWQVVEPGGAIQLVPAIKRSQSHIDQMSYVKTIVTNTGEVQHIYKPVYESTILNEPTANIPSIVYEDDQSSSTQSDAHKAVVDNQVTTTSPTATRQTVILSPQTSPYKGVASSAPIARHHDESRHAGLKSREMTAEQLQGVLASTGWTHLAQRRQLPTTVEQESAMSAETYSVTSKSFVTASGLTATQTSPLVQVSATPTQVSNDSAPVMRHQQLAQVTSAAETNSESAHVYSLKKVRDNQPEQLQTLNQVVTSVVPQNAAVEEQTQFFSSTVQVPTTVSEDTSADYLNILRANTSQQGLSSLRSLDIDYSDEMELENLKATIQSS